MIQISYDPFLGGLAPAVKIPKVYGAEKKGSSDAILEREGRTIRRPSRDCEFDCPFSLICLCPQGIRPSFARGCSDWFRYCSRAVFSSSLKLTSFAECRGCSVSRRVQSCDRIGWPIQIPRCEARYSALGAVDP
jgi:hypothetical protein